MVIWWGRRYSGAVGERDGQYGDTLFFHLYFVPIVPLSGRWSLGGGRAHATKIWWRSVLAGWLRGFGIGGGGLLAAIALVLLAAGDTGASTGVLGFLGLGMLAGGISTYAWRTGRTARERMRAQLNADAFGGTRCEPALFQPDLAAVLRAQLSEHWAKISDGKPPSDVAQFGASDRETLAIAYGMLALAAAAPGPHAHESDADAWRIVDRLLARPALPATHPYRETVAEARVPDDSAEKQALAEFLDKDAGEVDPETKKKLAAALARMK